MQLNKIYKNPVSYAALIFGLMAGTWSYGYLQTAIFPPESNRLLAAVIVSAVVAAVLFYFLAARLVFPVMEKMSKASRAWLWLSCALLGLFLYVSTVNFEYLETRYITPLLPGQKLVITARQNSAGSGEDITIQGFSTSLGEVSYTDMQVSGWKRDELDSKQLSLENRQENRIVWMGHSGAEAVLLFEKSPAGGEVDVAWNGEVKSFNLYAPKKGTLKVTQAFAVPVYAGWVPLALIMVMGFILAMVALFALALNSKIKARLHETRPYEWLWYALPMLLVWGFYLAVFFPGFMSKDSFNQWQQMVTGQYVDWHPPFHTFINWLITRVWYSPAAIALVQIAAMGGVLGWGLAVIRRAGTPAWLTWLTSILLAVSPANGAVMISIWKDVPFAITIVALSVLTLEIILTKGAWLQKKRNWIMLGVALALVVLFRQNGVLVSAAVLVALAAAYRQHWKRLGLSLLVFLVLMGLVDGGLYKILQVKPNQVARPQLIVYNVIAAHQFNGTPFTPQENELTMAPFPQGRLPYVCARNSDMFSRVDRVYLIQHTRQYLDLALRLTLRSPMVTINHFVCNGTFVYRIFQTMPLYSTIFLGVFPNDYGISLHSLFPAFRDQLTSLILISQDQSGPNWLLWRSPFWMFVLVSGCICFCLRRKSWKYLLLVIPALLVALPLIVLSLGQIFRYVYAVYLVGILLSGYFWMMAAAEPEEEVCL